MPLGLHTRKTLIVINGQKWFGQKLFYTFTFVFVFVFSFEEVEKKNIPNTI